MSEQSVLETLRRVPDRIILAVMGRDLELQKNHACLCGWMLREKLAEIRNVGASEVSLGSLDDSRIGCAEWFGGAWGEWTAIYHGVNSGWDLPIIERAFATRVDEAVNPPKRRARR